MKKLLVAAAMVLGLWAAPMAAAVNEDPAGGGNWLDPSSGTAQLGTAAWVCYEVAGYDGCP